MYSVLQWLMFLYIYCFLGWIWETMYVSVSKGKWVNRGFMHGPFLPIYGIGATAMVAVTIPFRGNYLLEFIVGIIGATVMEYYTGITMEKLFHLRYWDYSNCKCNLKGYICLKASLCWGVFAILIPELLHARVEKMVFAIPDTALQILVILLTAYISADFSESFREAMDFKEILINLSQSNQEIAAIEKRVLAVSEFISGDLKEKSEAGLKKINSTLIEGKMKYQKKTEQFNELRNKITLSIEELKKQGDEREYEKDRKPLREELEMYLRKLSDEENKRLVLRHGKAIRRSHSIMRRNPNIISDKYKDALDDLKQN